MYLALLQSLIATPSLSRAEDQTADRIEAFLRERGLAPQRHGNNVWLRSRNWVEGRPVILLNSHHDTVKPAAGYTRDPYQPTLEGGKLYGLGSNDAGGALVALIAAFVALENDPSLGCNLLLATTAEEEISGAGGVAALLPLLGPITAGIVGEPTLLDLAIAERGLVVIDGECRGVSGHAARQEGINALYLALDDIQSIRNHVFPRPSQLLGPTSANVTVLQAGTQHNVVPDRATFVIDLRVNEAYRNEEAVEELRGVCRSAVLTPRSLRLQSSAIAPEHPLVRAGLAVRSGAKTYGSPTLSDQALLPFPTLKLGPGDSARSHTADEFIYVAEIEEARRMYVDLLRAAY
ncbi:M20 family metallo-hydrolase [Neolewinella lacunae]|uniref:M20 family metallo-hydrolase n=1 Tax=Neolewinella lacunae TaxID=1517758 RepID=A0A923PMS3_9BACT|nr:M20 family metallo-hydrolase [Neolewinella lacunae]MBC6995586.1 M20 family metallo-hydrolase [Neolewinella lacunae]MDN3635622.1 M20 family metallo-hydrolase [Neolewinella lacunae]